MLIGGHADNRAVDPFSQMPLGGVDERLFLCLPSVKENKMNPTERLAFPLVESHLGIVHDSGMTLRDYFAGQALMSMLSAPDTIQVSTFAKAAELSYKFADAMMEAREQ